MNSQIDISPFIVPLTAANHQTAEKFYQQHSDPQKARQIYLNTLSVLSVNFYLTCLGVRTSVEQSQSWNPALQVLVDTADLWVDHFGRLECRAVLPNAEICVVPAQVWSDRIGYIVVQLNAKLTEAALLGFVRSVAAESLPLEALQPIDQFPNYLNSLTAIAPIVPVLTQWLQNQITAGWQTLETLLECQKQSILSFRTPTTFEAPALHTSGVKRGRLVALGTSKKQVLFLLEITPRTASEYQIRIELYPTGVETYLPRSLHLSVMDEVGKTVLQAENSNSEGLEFQFAAEVGEQFSVKISLQEDSIIEAFEV